MPDTALAIRTQAGAAVTVTCPDPGPAFEARIARELAAVAASVEPSPGGLTAIRRRTCTILRVTEREESS